MTTEHLASWKSADYVQEWAGDDVIADMLELPRSISAALVADLDLEVRRIIDLGAGPGAYLAAFLGLFPKARGCWVDSSEPMLELAREELARYGDRVQYVMADIERLADTQLEAAEVIVTSRVLHHFSADTLERTYREIHRLLTPGGLFFNLDHIGVPATWEPRYRRIRDRLTGPRKERLRPHRHDFPFSTLEQHRAWAIAAGLEDVDVPWRTLFTALLVARRPARAG